MRPRRLSGVAVRPLNFTVRRLALSRRAMSQSVDNAASESPPSILNLLSRGLLIAALGWGIAPFWKRVLNYTLGCAVGCSAERSTLIAEIAYWTLLPLLLVALHYYFVVPLRRRRRILAHRRQLAQHGKPSNYRWRGP